jgi:tRNA G18 (ribose-2'-O)-methylase SpoU
VPNVPREPRSVPPGPILEVVDPDDPRLDLYRHLNDPAGRVRLDSEQSVFVVEGRLAVARLLTSRYSMCSLLVDDHQVTAAEDLVMATRALGAPVFVGSRAVVADTVGFALHRGVVAVAHRPSPVASGRLLADAAGTPSPEGPLPRVAILEGLNDHENIGALFRNAAAFGVAGVLLDPTCADPLYRRSVRVSVGHVLHTPFARLEPWPAGLDQVRAAGFLVAALAPRPAAERGVPAISLAELGVGASGPDRPAGVALLLGAEGPGLTEGALAAADVEVTIPMAHGIDSLNVATAAAVAFHALAGP